MTQYGPVIVRDWHALGFAEHVQSAATRWTLPVSRHRHTDTDTDTQTQTHRRRRTHPQTQTHKHTDTQTQTHKHRHTDTQAHTHRRRYTSTHTLSGVPGEASPSIDCRAMRRRAASPDTPPCRCDGTAVGVCLCCCVCVAYPSTSVPFVKPGLSPVSKGSRRLRLQ